MSELMTKHEMTEEDIKLQYITPAIERAGWNKLKQIKMEYNFTDGRVIVRGNVTARGKKKRTDYLLYYIRILREFTRYRSKLVSMRSSEKNRFQNAFTVCNLTLDAVVSDMFGKSATKMKSCRCMVRS